MRRDIYVSIFAALAGLSACTNDAPARVEGHVTDGGGAQTRSFGGEGTISGAVAVQASALLPGGSLELLAEGELEADGSYSLELPAGETHVILQAVDASGEVMAAAVLEHSGPPGETVTATPIDSESSLEAAVLIEAAAQGAEVGAINVVDLRARVTSEVAIGVRIADARGDDVGELVGALAAGVRAAQESELAVYARGGASVSQAQLFEAELAASQELDAALDAGAPAQAAYDTFFEARAQARAALGVDAEAQGRAEAAASASFRATVEARISSEASASIRESALLAAASLEARAQERAIAAILAAGEASGEVQASAAAAASALRAEVSAAATADAAAEAYARFAASVHGEASVEGSILGAYLDAGVAGTVAVDAAVAASATAAAQLDLALDAAFTASLQTTGAVDGAALAADVAAAYATYTDTMEAQGAVLASTSDAVSADAAVSLLIVADASFR